LGRIRRHDAVESCAARDADLDRDIGIYGESGLPVVFGLLKLYGAGGVVLVRGARPFGPLGDMRPGVAADGRFRRTGLRVANPMTRHAADGTTCRNGCDENELVQAGLLPAPAHSLPGRQVQAQGQALWPGRPPLTPAQSAARNRQPQPRAREESTEWNPNTIQVACWGEGDHFLRAYPKSVKRFVAETWSTGPGWAMTQPA
jgi:hypothetical protein